MVFHRSNCSHRTEAVVSSQLPVDRDWHSHSDLIQTLPQDVHLVFVGQLQLITHHTHICCRDCQTLSSSNMLKPWEVMDEKSRENREGLGDLLDLACQICLHTFLHQGLVVNQTWAAKQSAHSYWSCLASCLFKVGAFWETCQGRRALSSDVEIVWALERDGQEWGEWMEADTWEMLDWVSKRLTSHANEQMMPCAFQRNSRYWLHLQGRWHCLFQQLLLAFWVRQISCKKQDCGRNWIYICLVLVCN